MEFESWSEEQTELVAERLGGALRPGDVVGLSGELGAGKTAFVRGLARGLGVDPHLVHSPTFVTAAEHRGRQRLVHVDLYRHENGLADAGWLHEVLDSDAITAIEWIERLGEDAPRDLVLVRIERAPAREERTIRLQADGPRGSAALDRLTGPSPGEKRSAAGGASGNGRRAA